MLPHLDVVRRQTGRQHFAEVDVDHQRRLRVGSHEVDATEVGEVRPLRAEHGFHERHVGRQLHRSFRQCFTDRIEELLRVDDSDLQIDVEIEHRSELALHQRSELVLGSTEHVDRPHVGHEDRAVESDRLQRRELDQALGAGPRQLTRVDQELDRVEAPDVVLASRIALRARAKALLVTQLRDALLLVRRAGGETTEHQQ